MRILFASFLCLQTAVATAQLYRWTDSSGRVHYTDTPPPAAARSIEAKASSVPAVGQPVEPYALQQARKNFPITYYSAPGCQVCDKGRALLNARGVPFREISVRNQEQFEALKSLVGGPSVPALIVGSDVYKGFEATAYHAMLDVAGYPKAGILRPGTQQAPAAGEQPTQDSENESTERPLGPYAPRFR